MKKRNPLWARYPSMIPGIHADEIMYLDYDFNGKPYVHRIAAWQWQYEQEKERKTYEPRRYKESNAENLS